MRWRKKRQTARRLKSKKNRGKFISDFMILGGRDQFATSYFSNAKQNERRQEQTRNISLLNIPSLCFIFATYLPSNISFQVFLFFNSAYQQGV